MLSLKQLPSNRGALWRCTVHSKKLEYRRGPIYADLPSSLGFGVAGQGYSNFLASAAGGDRCRAASSLT